MRSLVLICCLVASTAQAQLPPDKALAAFQVADGIQVELFAAEPLFSNPTCIDVDERGRVWVCESVNYRHKLHKRPPNRPEGDRIVILADTDGDGKADKTTTFYQHKDFLAPLGIAVSKDPVGPGYQVYVCHSPHIYLFTDKNGDGQADGPPKVLLTGFGGVDHDHGVHGIHFGPDGMLYFSVGDQGVKNLSEPRASASGTEPRALASGVGLNSPAESSAPSRSRLGKDSPKSWTTNHTDCKAGTIWRCRPDGTGLELLAHNFRNQYEPAVNSFGTMFVSDNDDDGNQQTRICHVLYGGDYGYWPRNRGDHHWHEDWPGIVPKTLRTGFGSPTGMCWYEGTLLQGAFRQLLSRVRMGADAAAGTTAPAPLANARGSEVTGYLLHTDAGPREVRLFGVRPKGAGYELDQVNLLTSSDNWFRPSDVCVAPDGSIFVSDWYDPGVGGHGMGDTTRGRIYRITEKGAKGYQVPPSDLSNARGVVQTLYTGNIATRQLALQALDKKYPKDAFKALIWFFDTRSPILAPRLMWATQYLVKAEITPPRDYEQHLSKVDDSFEHPQMTELYTRIFKNLGFPPDPERVNDEKSISGLREILIALRDIDPETARPLINTCMKRYDGHDRMYLAALNIAVGTDPQRRRTILADFEKHFPEWNDTTAKLVWELRPPGVVAKLGERLATQKMTPRQQELALGALAHSPDVEGGDALMHLLQHPRLEPRLAGHAAKTLAQHLPGKWSRYAELELLRPVIDNLLKDRRQVGPVLDLITAAQREEYLGFLERVAFNTEGFPEENRDHAIASLAKFKAEAALQALIKLARRTESQKPALHALASVGTNEALAPVKELFQSAEATPETRRLALEALAASRPGTTWLLDLNAKKALPELLRPDVGRLLRNSPYVDLRNKALIAFPVAAKLDPAKLPTPAALAKRLGNAEQGRTLVMQHKELACTKCHSFQGVGGHIGPDLSMIGLKGSAENLFESLLHPDKAVADQFVQYVIETKAGVTLSGLLVEETADALTLRDANGKDTRIARADIEQQKKSNKSLMPANLAAFITEEELVDVVAFLATLKSPALAIDRWQVIGPFPNGPNDAGLEKLHGPEVAYDATATYQGKNGNRKWHPRSVDATGYLDLAALHGGQANDSSSIVYAEFELSTAGTTEIKLGPAGAMKVYLNDEIVSTKRSHETAQPGRDTLTVDLAQGKHKLMIKLTHTTGPHGLYCTILGPGAEPPRLRKLP